MVIDKLDRVMEPAGVEKYLQPTDTKVVLVNDEDGKQILKRTQRLVD